MRRKLLFIALLCFFVSVAAACGDGKTDINGDLVKYIEFHPVSGFYEGKAYTVNLPYIIDELYTVDIRSANKNIDRFADIIKESSKDSGYKVEASCVLTGENLISIRLTGKYDSGPDKNENIWAVNYNIEDNTAESIATTDFPYSENYRAWLQFYLNEYYKGAENGNVRIYDFNVPFIYYTDESKLMAAATFIKLSDGGIIQSSFAEVDISQGPRPYFTEEELANIGDIIYNGYDGFDQLPVSGSAEYINDEYAIALTYFDDDANKYASHIFALDQPAPVFPKIFDAFTLTVSFEENRLPSGDYTKVYTFTDNAGYKRFVLKTQYWGEKDWKSGFEKIIYVGTDYVGDAYIGSLRGYMWGGEEELIASYPHDLYVASQVIPDAHSVINMSKPSKAYIYKDPNDYSNKDLVYIVKNGIIISMDIASSYEYSRYDTALKLSKPVSTANSKASGLDVKTVSSYKGEFDVQDVLPDYIDGDILTGEDRPIRVNINVPGVDPKVPDAAKINKLIANFSPYTLRIAEKLNNGDLKVLAEVDLLGYAAMDYKVYNYNNAAALVVKSEGYLFQAGGGIGYLIVYYDCDTGNIITAREYLKKCGIAESDLLQLSSEKGYTPSIIWGGVIKSAYDVNFVVDDGGEIILYTEMAD
jgi:hypothetical protein